MDKRDPDSGSDDAVKGLEESRADQSGEILVLGSEMGGRKPVLVGEDDDDATKQNIPGLMTVSSHDPDSKILIVDDTL